MTRGGTHTDAEFLEYVVKSLVDHSDDVKVDRKVDEMGVLLTLKVHAGYRTERQHRKGYPLFAPGCGIEKQCPRKPED